jgi:hypothetical protein
MKNPESLDAEINNSDYRPGGYLNSYTVRSEKMTQECSRCNKRIGEREIFWSVELHQEFRVGRRFTVLDAVAQLFLCEDCADLHDLECLAVPMKIECPSCGRLNGSDAQHCCHCRGDISETAQALVFTSGRNQYIAIS